MRFREKDRGDVARSEERRSERKTSQGEHGVKYAHPVGLSTRARPRSRGTGAGAGSGRIADGLGSVQNPVHHSCGLEDASVALIVVVGQYKSRVVLAVQTGAVIGIAHDGVVAVGGGNLGSVGDKDGGAKEVKGGVEVVIDKVHEVGR